MTDTKRRAPQVLLTLSEEHQPVLDALADIPVRRRAGVILRWANLGMLVERELLAPKRQAEATQTPPQPASAEPSPPSAKIALKRGLLGMADKD